MVTAEDASRALGQPVEKVVAPLPVRQVKMCQYRAGANHEARVMVQCATGHLARCCPRGRGAVAELGTDVFIHGDGIAVSHGDTLVTIRVLGEGSTVREAALKQLAAVAMSRLDAARPSPASS